MKKIRLVINNDIKKNKATHKIVILCGEDHTPCGFLGSMAASEQSMYKMCAKPLFIQSGKQIALVQCLENAVNAATKNNAKLIHLSSTSVYGTQISEVDSAELSDSSDSNPESDFDADGHLQAVSLLSSNAPGEFQVHKGIMGPRKVGPKSHIWI